VIRRKDLKSATGAAARILTRGLMLTEFGIRSTRAGDSRAHSEIASARRMSVLTVSGPRHFCAPVARIEEASPPNPGIPATAIH
jgi:hypothetical protein